MNRYNIFNQIHKGLRVVLFETATAIQQTDFSNREASIATIDQLQKTLQYFDGHAEHEDSFIFPLVQRADPRLASLFTDEHHEDEALTKNLRRLITAWYAADEGTALTLTGREILYAFNSFIAFNLEHMNREEQLLNKALWENYSDLEILHIEQQIIASLPMELLLEESRFMMRGINNRELVTWLSGMKRHAPEPVYQMYVRMMGEEVGSTRSEAIVKELAVA